jgi:hypothetical protein
MSQPKIFISYSHKDRDAAVRICETLQKVGLQVWFDDSSLSLDKIGSPESTKPYLMLAICSHYFRPTQYNPSG